MAQLMSKLTKVWFSLFPAERCEYHFERGLTIRSRKSCKR